MPELSAKELFERDLFLRSPHPAAVMPSPRPRLSGTPMFAPPARPPLQNQAAPPIVTPSAVRPGGADRQNRLQQLFNQSPMYRFASPAYRSVSSTTPLAHGAQAPPPAPSPATLPATRARTPSFPAHTVRPPSSDLQRKRSASTAPGLSPDLTSSPASSFEHIPSWTTNTEVSAQDSAKPQRVIRKQLSPAEDKPLTSSDHSSDSRLTTLRDVPRAIQSGFTLAVSSNRRGGSRVSSPMVSNERKDGSTDSSNRKPIHVAAAGKIEDEIEWAKRVTSAKPRKQQPTRQVGEDSEEGELDRPTQSPSRQQVPQQPAESKKTAPQLGQTEKANTSQTPDTEPARPVAVKATARRSKPATSSRTSPAKDAEPARPVAVKATARRSKTAAPLPLPTSTSQNAEPARPVPIKATARRSKTAAPLPFPTSTSHNAETARPAPIKATARRTKRTAPFQLPGVVSVDVPQASTSTDERVVGVKTGQAKSVKRQTSDELKEENERWPKRMRMKPLAFWRNERIVYSLNGEQAKSGPAVPQIKEIIKIDSPDSESPRSASRQPARHSRRAQKESVEGQVVDFTTGEKTTRLLAVPKDEVVFKATSKLSVKFVKTVDDPGLLDAGLIQLNPHAVKKPEPSEDTAVAFYVVSGSVEVRIEDNVFIMSAGGQFVVPRGNTYGLRNIGSERARVFFAQATDTLYNKTREESSVM